MEDSFTYRLMKIGEETEVCELIIRSFNEFVASSCSQEGIREFLKYAQSNSLLKRSQTNHFVLVATERDKIVGMIEIRDNKHISMLFVDKAYHRRGISKRLVRSSLEISRLHNPNLREFSVNSSPYAVTIYEKLGFFPKSPEQTMNGIRFVPMVLDVSEADGSQYLPAT